MFVIHNKNGCVINSDWYKLEIIHEEDMFFLLTYHQNGMVGDTCHFSLKEAMTQAREVLGVHECDWTEVPDEE